jgi:Ca-activated chloride channel family protein
MTFARFWILHFFWLLPLAALALIFYSRQRKRAMEQFADPELMVRLTEKERKGKAFLQGLLMLGALGLMLFALAGPRWGSHYQEVSQKGVDIMILVDVSPSMLVEDIEPNRLERARREILDFLRVVQGDRVGLVAFSGAAYVQCPLTLDYGALQMFLDALQPDLIPVPGTDLGAAVESGLSAFDYTSETDKVILLITDGEDNENRGLEAAGKAAEKGVKIFVFGMGEMSGGPIPAGDGKGGFRKDEAGKLVLSRLDEAGLREIAATTGGTYVRSVAGDLDLDLLYFEGIKSRTEAATLKSGKIKVYEERFMLFLLAAFLLLFVEGFIYKGARRKAKARIKAYTFIILLPLVPIFSNHAWGAEADPDELYRQGRFAEAEKAYARSDMDNPKDIRYRYNRGCAAYQNSDFQGAMAAFKSVSRRAEDDETRYKTAYNLGNAAFKQGDFASAVMQYRQALLIKPGSDDARVNLELALKALARQKSEKTEEQKDQSQEDSSQPGDPGDASQTDKEQEGAGESSKDKGADQESPQTQDQQDENGQSGPDQGQQSEQEGDAGTGEGPKSEAGSTQDLSGELAPLQAMPEEQTGDQIPDTAMSMIDKKKAEALLDNIKEDRSRFLHFQVPKDKRHGVRSGKDW